MSYFPIFSKFFDSVSLSTDTNPNVVNKVFKVWSEKYHGGLPSLPELDWLVRNDDRKLITTNELTAIESAYKSACVTAFGYWLGFGTTGLYFSRNLWQHWPTPARVLLVAGSVFVPFYYIPIARTDRGLLRDLSTHDTWLGQEIRQRTPTGYWAEEEKLEAQKAAKNKKQDALIEGYKVKTPVTEVTPAAAAEAGHGHH